MKSLTLFLLTIYQSIVSPLLHQLLGQKNLCRYEVSCSDFAKEAITKYGVFKGGSMAVKRVLSCQPFTKGYGNRIFS